MDSQIFLVVEGIADKKFLIDLVSFTFNKKLEPDNFLVTNGYGANWISKHRPSIQIAIKNGMHPVLLPDANGNFQLRQTDILNELQQFNMAAIPLFILPNNASIGNLETLLFSMMLPQHSAINVCFDQYKACIPNGYTKPIDKVKVFSYAAALLPYSRRDLAQDGKRDYTDNNIWDLASPLLNDLKTFLTAHV